MEFSFWTVVFSVLLLLLLAYLFLKWRAGTISSFGFLGRIGNGRPKICPHVGLADDPFSHEDKPCEAHRCFVWMQRDQVDVDHQKGFCLSVAHQFCPWLTIGSAGGSGGSKRPLLDRLVAGLDAFANSLGLGTDTGWGDEWGDSRSGFGKLADQAAAKLPILEDRVAALSRHLATRTAWALRWARPRIAMAAAFVAHAVLGRLRQGGTPAARQDESLADGWDDELLEPVTLGTASVAEAAVEVQTSVPTGDDVERLMADGKAAGMAGNRKAAYAYFSVAAELDPDNEEVWTWKAAMADKAEEKQRCLEKALALNPANARVRASMGEFPQTRREEPQAVEVGEQFMPTPAPEAVVQRWQVTTEASANMGPLEQGLVALERGNEDGAYRLFMRATELDPGSEKAWFWRAKTATSLPELVSCLERALAINPKNEKVRSNLVWALERLNREQQRQRYAQPFAAGMAPIAGGSQPAAAAKRAGVAKQKESRSEIVCSIAGMSALLLGFYWLWGALVPIMGLPQTPFSAELARLLPGFTFSGETLYPSFEVAPGYNLLDALPFAVGFLFVFVARGLFQREPWAVGWGILLGAATVASALRFVSNPDATIVGYALCMILAAGIFAGRKELVANG